MWIGFERFVVLSNVDDVRAVLNTSNDRPLMEKFNAMWPWIGVDSIKSNDFPCEAFTDVITSSALNDFTKSIEFVEHMSRRFGALCKHNIGHCETVDLQSLSRMMMFDILTYIAIGNNVGPQRKDLLEQAEKLITLADKRIYSGLQQSSFICTLLGNERQFRNAHEIFAKIIAKNFKSDNDSSVKSVYDALRVQYPQINAISIITSFITLGYDRFSVAFTSMIMELAKDEDLIENLFREIKSHNRNFMKCENLNKFLVENLPMHPTITVIDKIPTTGIPLNGYFIPPGTNCLLYLENAETYGKLMKNFDDSMTMNLMKIFVGECIARCKFNMNMEKNEVIEYGAGISMKRKGVNVFVRNRY
jgi:cytochrome P450